MNRGRLDISSSERSHFDDDRINAFLGEPKKEPGLVVERGGLIRSVPKQIDVLGAKYLLGADPLGSGAYGVVYHAEPLAEAGSALMHQDRFVVKFLQLDTRSRIESGYKEIAGWSASGSLVDAHIIETEQGEKVLQIVLEKMRGRMLSEKRDQWGSRGSLTSRDWLDAMRAMRSYLEQLKHLDVHHGAVHLDIKPANLMFDEDNPERSRIIDFGLTEKKDTYRKKDARFIHGTPRYLTPLAVMMTPDERRDEYALALSIAESTGLMSYENCSNLQEIMRKIEFGEYVRCQFNLQNYHERLRGFLPLSTEREFAAFLYRLIQPRASAGFNPQHQTVEWSGKNEFPGGYPQIIETLDRLIERHDLLCMTERALDQVRMVLGNEVRRGKDASAFFIAKMARKEADLKRAIERTPDDPQAVSKLLSDLSVIFVERNLVPMWMHTPSRRMELATDLLKQRADFAARFHALNDFDEKKYPLAASALHQARAGFVIFKKNLDEGHHGLARAVVDQISDLLEDIENAVRQKSDLFISRKVSYSKTIQKEKARERQKSSGRRPTKKRTL